jgi:cytochrome c biogenesis protein CcmG/thiol:disulfide interchange protein DsbE
MIAPPEPPSRRTKLDLAAIPRRRRILWTTAALALTIMGLAAWQLGDARDTRTATEALDLAAPAGSGTAASDFTVALRDGGEFSLSDHLAVDGRPVLLNLWASWCIPCRNEMPLLDEVAPLYPSVLFLGVAVNDTRANAESFAAEVGVSYPLGFDMSGELTDSYPAPAMPVTYVIAEDGTIPTRFFGELTADRLAELLADVD